MSEKEPEAKAKRENEKVLMEFIETHMGRSYEEISVRDILRRRPHEKIDRDERIEIAKRIQSEFEEGGKLDDLHFKAAATAGLVEEELEP